MNPRDRKLVSSILGLRTEMMLDPENKAIPPESPPEGLVRLIQRAQDRHQHVSPGPLPAGLVCILIALWEEFGENLPQRVTVAPKSSDRPTPKPKLTAKPKTPEAPVKRQKMTAEDWVDVALGASVTEWTGAHSGWRTGKLTGKDELESGKLEVTFDDGTVQIRKATRVRLLIEQGVSA